MAKLVGRDLTSEEIEHVKFPYDRNDGPDCLDFVGWTAKIKNTDPKSKLNVAIKQCYTNGVL